MNVYMFIIIFNLLLTSCAPSLQGVCRHDALYCASVAVEKYPVRVWTGRPGHAQSQAKIEGKWEWLSHLGTRECRPGAQDAFKAEHVYTLQEYIDVMKGNYPWK